MSVRFRIHAGIKRCNGRIFGFRCGFIDGFIQFIQHGLYQFQGIPTIIVFEPKLLIFISGSHPFRFHRFRKHMFCFLKDIFGRFSFPPYATVFQQPSTQVPEQSVTVASPKGKCNRQIFVIFQIRIGHNHENDHVLSHKIEFSILAVAQIQVFSEFGESGCSIHISIKSFF